MTTKRILFAVLCVLLLLVIIMTVIVVSKISTLFSGSQATTPTDGASAPSTSPSGNQTDPTEYTPSFSTTPPHDHQYELTETISATCDSYGWNIYNCTICGDMDMPQDERIDPLGHSYARSELVEPTCTAGGYSVFTCQRCNKSVQRDETQPLEHLFDDGVEVPPTCGEDGYLLFTCQREGCTETKAEVHENTATGQHTFGEWISNEDGTESRTCTVCGTAEARDAGEQASLTVTSQKTDAKTDGAGKSYILYTVTVGTEEEPEQYIYHIYNYTDQALTFAYDATDGLVVTYADTTGEMQQAPMGIGSFDATLDELGFQLNLG